MICISKAVGKCLKLLLLQISLSTTAKLNVMKRVIRFDRPAIVWMLCLLAAVSSKATGFKTVTGPANAKSGFKVVAYMPATSGTANDIQYQKVTHINYASVRPTITGGLTPLDNGQKLRDIVAKAHANNVEVGISVGGWDDLRNDDFESMAATSGSRQAFIKNIIALMDEYQLDGVDIDWEYPATIQDQSNFAILMTELSMATHAKGKFVSAAVAANGHYADRIQSSIFSSVDFLNVLAYDGGSDEMHAPFNYAASAIHYWVDRGLNSSKIVLGIPFHARPTWKSFKTLVAEGANPTTDLHQANYYNGIYTVIQKTDLAFDRNIGGVMVSNLSYDATGSNSLLSAISSVVLKRSPAVAVQRPYNGVRFAIPGEIEAEQYDLGGEGLGYHDLSRGNSGGAFRYDNVDIEVNPGMIDDHKVAGIEAGEWLNYSVIVTTAGAMTLHASVASASAGKTFHIELDGIDISGKLTVPNTGGWQNWRTVSVNTSYIPKGKKNLRIVMDSGDFAISKVVFLPIEKSDETVADDDVPGLVLHPNPGVSGAAQNIMLTFETGQQKLAVSISDMSGYKVFTQRYDAIAGNALQVSLPGLPPGIYIVRVQGDNKTWSKKYLVK